MASHKTNKRSYKKRTPKRKTQKGGDFTILGYNCTEDKKKDKVVGEGADEGDANVDYNNENGKGEDPEGQGKGPEEVDYNNETGKDDDSDEKESVDENETVVGAGKKGRKSRKSTKKGRKPHKKNRKTMKKKSAWTTFVVDLYNKNKLKTKGYMFKNALSDAAKIYKK